MYIYMVVVYADPRRMTGIKYLISVYIHIFGYKPI
jgi:hypothetical protein